MALSDQLSSLSARTKELERRATQAGQEARGDLQKDVAAARDASKANAEALHESVEAGVADVSAWWTDIGRDWDAHIEKMRKQFGQRKAEHDLASAKRNAEDAYAYASYLIDYCYAAVDEAEYAVLDAVLAQLDYDELAARQPAEERSAS